MMRVYEFSGVGTCNQHERVPLCQPAEERTDSLDILNALVPFAHICVSKDINSVQGRAWRQHLSQKSFHDIIHRILVKINLQKLWRVELVPVPFEFRHGDCRMLRFTRFASRRSIARD